MRDLASPDLHLVDLRPGGWLHLDVSAACAGNILTAALLDLGVTERVLREALMNAGLEDVSPRQLPSSRGGLRGVHLDYLGKGGIPLEEAAHSRTAYGRPVSDPDRRAKRRAQPRVALTRNSADKRAAQSLPSDDESVAGNDDDTGPRPGRRVTEAWLNDEPATLTELQAFMAQWKLAPLLNARVQKTIKRLFTSLCTVKGCEAKDIKIPGKEAIDILVDVVAFHALLGALSPAKVTASFIALSTAPVREAHFVHGDARSLTPGPSSWTLEILRDVPTRYIEANDTPTTPTGAALLWSVVHRYGPPQGLQHSSMGVGLGTRVVATRANMARALYGKSELPTQKGAQQLQPQKALKAFFWGPVPGALLAKLTQEHGAQRPPKHGSMGEEFFVPAARADDLCRALHRAGAHEVQSQALTTSTLIPHLEHIALKGLPGLPKVSPEFRARVHVLEFENEIVGLRVDDTDLALLTSRYGRDLNYWTHAVRSLWEQTRGAQWRGEARGESSKNE